jgi:hypothetical protein
VSSWGPLRGFGPRCCFRRRTSDELPGKPGPPRLSSRSIAGPGQPRAAGHGTRGVSWPALVRRVVSVGPREDLRDGQLGQPLQRLLTSVFEQKPAQARPAGQALEALPQRDVDGVPGLARHAGDRPGGGPRPEARGRMVGVGPDQDCFDRQRDTAAGPLGLQPVLHVQADLCHPPGDEWLDLAVLLKEPGEGLPPRQSVPATIERHVDQLPRFPGAAVEDPARPMGRPLAGGRVMKIGPGQDVGHREPRRCYVAEANVERHGAKGRRSSPSGMRCG